MTITEAKHTTVDAVTDTATDSKSTASDLIDGTRSAVGQVRDGVGDAIGRVPDVLDSAKSGIDQVADQDRLFPHAGGYGPPGASMNLVLTGSILEKVEPHQHGGERRPNLVGDDREELFLHPARVFGQSTSGLFQL